MNIKNKCVVIQGWPGSGKSTLAKQLADKYTNEGHHVRICSTDHYFMEKGVYCWDVNKLGLYHKFNLEDATNAMTNGLTVIVDNTNLKRRDVRPYVKVALDLGIPIEFHRATGNYQTIHGVTSDKVEVMKNSMEELSVELVMKEPEVPKPNVFFTSDLHLAHGNGIKYCRRDIFLSDEDKKELDRLGGKWGGRDDDLLINNGVSRQAKNVINNANTSYKISKEAIDKMDDYLIKRINDLVGKEDILYMLGDFCFGYDKVQKAKEFRDRIYCSNIYFVWGNHDNRGMEHLFTRCSDMIEESIFSRKIIMCHYA
ncbi:MAG: AAA family ATPase, partial [Rhabdochlamydiaceae bacterium]